MPEKIVEVQGLKISYRDEGQGMPFLILHGWGVGKKHWSTVQDSLAKHFRTIIFDFPGFGNSDNLPKAWAVQDFVDFFIEFLKKLEINNQFYLAGQSFGGRVTIKFANQHPEKVKALFLIDAAGIKHKITVSRWILRIVSRVIKKFAWIPGYKLLQKAFYKFVLRKTDYINALGTKKDTFIKVVKEDLTPFLQKIQVKTYIIWGEHDKTTPVSDAYIMHDKISNSELKFLPSGHRPHVETPNLLADMILKFLNL